jgi:hypothetical protein
MAYELSQYKPELFSPEVGSDTKEHNMTVAERDDETLARLGKKPVLKVWLAENSIASSGEAFPIFLHCKLTIDSGILVL